MEIDYRDSLSLPEKDLLRMDMTGYGTIVSNPFLSISQNDPRGPSAAIPSWLATSTRSTGDAFVLLDTVPIQEERVANRNRIKRGVRPQWLTVPVTYRFPQRICEVGINGRERWQHQQRQALLSSYRKAPFWGALAPFLEEILDRSWENLAVLNVHVGKRLVELLGIATPLYVASALGPFPEDPDERLIAMTRHFGADTYLAGAGGRSYMDLAKYGHQGVKVLFQEYRHPVYRQRFGPFEPNLSVLDLLLNCGPESLAILRGKG
jgi:hypothetical protein